MQKYFIIPKKSFEEEIMAENADEAMCNFAFQMDTDMNNYFMAVTEEELKKIRWEEATDSVGTIAFMMDEMMSQYGIDEATAQAYAEEAFALYLKGNGETQYECIEKIIKNHENDDEDAFVDRRYVLTSLGRERCTEYIKKLETERKAILDAGKDTADETELPTVEAIEGDIGFIGLNDEGEYYNSWAITDEYSSENVITLKFGEDFVFTGYIPDENEEVICAEQYSLGTYDRMIPETIVLDYKFSSYWKVLSNDGAIVKLQNMSGGKNGVKMDISLKDNNCNIVFSLLCPTTAPED